jgi:hypothetical protein
VVNEPWTGAALIVVVIIVARKTRHRKWHWGRSQVDLSRDISAKLRRRLSGADMQRLTKRDTGNAEAYEFYLKGRHALNTLTGQQHNSLEYFQRAIEKDPRYALAYAGMAEAYAEMADLGTTTTLPPKEAYSQVKAAALKAVEFDDTLAEAHVSLGRLALNLNVSIVF